MPPRTCLNFFSIFYFPSAVFGDRTQLHGLRTSSLLSTVLDILWWAPSPACLWVGNKAFKTSFRLSFTSAVQSRSCPGRKPTLWVLWHFPPSHSDTFFCAFSKGQSTSDRHESCQHCPSEQTQQWPRGEETLGKRLWGVSGNYECLNGQQTEQKIPSPADQALGSCPACTRAVDPCRMQSAPGSAEFYFSCLFGQIMETDKR